MTGVIPPEAAAVVARFATAMTDSAMRSIDHASLDQDGNALGKRSLRAAIRSGITDYLHGEIERHRTRHRKGGR